MRGADCLLVLILNKLLKILDAQIGQNAAYAVPEYTTSTRDFRGNGSRARSLLELRKPANGLTERYGLSPLIEGYFRIRGRPETQDSVHGWWIRASAI